MKYIKLLNEHGANAESEHYQEGGLEGVSGKDVLGNVYPLTLEAIIKDFDSQCEDDIEFKNKNLDMLRSIIGFAAKYANVKSKFLKSMMIKYNLK